MLETNISNICLGILKREDVKKELNNLIVPLLELILVDIYPYIYLSICFVIISFLIHLGILILLLHNNKFSYVSRFFT